MTSEAEQRCTALTRANTAIAQPSKLVRDHFQQPVCSVHRVLVPESRTNAECWGMVRWMRIHLLPNAEMLWRTDRCFLVLMLYTPLGWWCWKMLDCTTGEDASGRKSSRSKKKIIAVVFIHLKIKSTRRRKVRNKNFTRERKWKSHLLRK